MPSPSASLKLLLALLAATCSTSYAQPTTPAAPPYDVTVRDTLRQGLIVWAVNAYCPSRDWDAYLDRFNRPRQALSPVPGFFGTPDRRKIVPQIADLHARILHELRKRISRGPLRRSDWALGHELALNVLTLNFDVRMTPGSMVEWYGEMAVSAVLRSTSADSIVFRRDPPLLVRVARTPRVPGSGMDDLVGETAGAIYDSLKTAWGRLQVAGQPAP